MKPNWFAKDLSTKHEDLIKQAKEPGVVKAVLDEIGTLGGKIKEQYTELMKNHDFLKKLVDKHKDQFEKLPGDIKE